MFSFVVDTRAKGMLTKILRGTGCFNLADVDEDQWVDYMLGV